jgi:ubiquinone/menaquinone biosynthesis C-methylase UbiE
MPREVFGTSEQDRSVVSQYDAWARVYDWFWRRYMNKTLPVAQRTAAVASGEQVLDLACGTGALLARIARDTPRANLAGIDVAPQMVRRAREKLDAAADVRRGDAHNLPFAAGTFDSVVCANTFHYFTQPTTVLAEARRVLKPEGRLVILDWCRDYWTCRLMDRLLHLIDPAHNACYTLGGLTTLLQDAGFEVQTAGRYRFDLVWGMMVTKAVLTRPEDGPDA